MRGKIDGILIIALALLVMVYDWNCRPYHAIGFSLLVTPMLLVWGVTELRRESNE